MKFRYCFYCKKPVTKQNFRSRHLHASLDPNNKKKDEKEVDRKKKRNKDKAESKTKMDSETKKSILDKDPSISTSEENFKKPVADDDDKDSIESLAALPINNNEKEDCCNGKNFCSDRPSKIQKLSNSDQSLKFGWEETIIPKKPIGSFDGITPIR